MKELTNEMDTIKVSIVMPVYKVEKYVRKAIESILTQTLKEFEFFIVDDGSPDNCRVICEQYATTDERIRFIHKENGGAPSARNVAMDVAKGKYLYFMDSDDWAEPKMLEDMYTLAREKEAQMVVAGFYIDTYYNETEFLTTDYIPETAFYENECEFRLAAYKLFDKNMLYQPWNKLFLRSYIEERYLRFPTTFWDDFPFVLSVIEDVERVGVISGQYYHFLRARAESETAKFVPQMYEKREEEDRWMCQLYQQWDVRNAESMEMISRRYIERFIGCIENLANPRCSLSEIEKMQSIKEMLANPRVDESLKLARIGSTYMNIMLVPVRWKNASLLLLEAKVISYVKKNHPKWFAILKARR